MGEDIRRMSKELGLPTYVIGGIWDILSIQAGKSTPRGTLPVPDTDGMDWLVSETRGDRDVIEHVIQACLKKNWIVKEDGRYRIVDWDELQGAPAEQDAAQRRLEELRASAADRQRRRRARLKAEQEAAAKAAGTKPPTSGSPAPSSKVAGAGSSGGASSGATSSAGDGEKEYCGLKGERLAWFEALWTAYDHPRRGEKPPAARAYGALANWTPELAERLVAAARLCTSEDGVKAQGGFIMKLKNWLKDEAFNNDYAAMIKRFKEKQNGAQAPGAGRLSPGQQTLLNIMGAGTAPSRDVVDVEVVEGGVQDAASATSGGEEESYDDDDSGPEPQS